MLVGSCMSHPPLTISPDMPIQEALNKMRKDRVRRYPVMDANGTLLGIVSELDLLNASPSDATSLSVWEINYLVSKITVSSVMSKNVMTVTEDVPVEEAARIMADQKIGGLPVMRGHELVGIITETDIFRLFVDLFGARQAGLRLTAHIKDQPGALMNLTQAISAAGGNILALGLKPDDGTVVIKVNSLEMDAFKAAVEPFVNSIIDLR